MSSLLERASELAALEDAIRTGRRGRGRLVLVEGAAGVGKSRLLAAAAGGARAGDLGVHAATASEPDRDLPFGLVRRLLGPALDALDGRERALVLGGAARLAAPLFDPGAPAPDAFAAVHGAFWLVANLAERRPLVLLADDLHWADDASLRVLAQLGRHAAELPVAVLAAARIADGRPVAPALAAVRQAAGDAVLRPAPLSEHAVAAHVRATAFPDADDAFCAACAQASGGNPFRLDELLRTLRDEDAPPTAASAERVREAGPAAVGRAALERVAALGAPARAVAEALAVLGDDPDPTVLAATAAALSGAAAGDGAVAALRAAGVLGDGLAFRHPLIREAVLGALGGDERAALHAAAAQALRAAGAPADRVAEQVLHAPPGDPAAAATLREAAASAVAAGLPDHAAALLERALAEHLPDAERAAVEVDLGRAELAAGREAGVARLAAVAERLPPPARAAVLGELGRAHQNAGRLPEAVGAYAAAMELAGSDDPLGREVRAAYAGLAMWVPEQRDAALALVRPLVEQERPVESLADRLLLSSMAAAESFALGDPGRAADLARRAWGGGAWVEQGGGEQVVMSNITGTLNAVDAFDEVAAIGDAALAHAARNGLVRAFATASYLRGSSATLAGRATEAQDHLERALGAAVEGWESWLPSARGHLGEVAVLRGDLDRAQELLALPPAGRSPEGQSALDAWYWGGRGTLDLALEDWAGALASFALAGRLIEEGLGVRNPAVLAWRTGAAHAAARLGDAARARALAEEDVELARRWGAGRTLGAALTALGRATGDRAALEEAVAEAARSGAPRAHAGALLALGIALAEAGADAAARDPLRRALDVARRAGLTGVAARARTVLVAAGGRPRRAAQTGAEALTPAERRVATLAAAGLTNREIAEALFVTPKTVEWHLNVAFRKLGVTSRTRIAPLLEAA